MVESRLNPPPPPSTPQNAPWTDAEKIEALLAQINANLQALVKAAGGQPVTINVPEQTGGGYPPNYPAIDAQQFIPSAAGKAQPLPPMNVPYGMKILIKASPDNTGYVWVGPSQSGVETYKNAWPLVQNEPVGYEILNGSEVWVMTDNGPPDAVYMTVERNY